MESSTYLKSCPSDTISTLQFSPTNDTLLVSSWDSTISLFDAYSTSETFKHTSKAAILSCSFSQDQTSCYFGGLEQKLKKLDFAKGVELDIGHHDEAVKCVEYDPYSKCIYSGSWDKSLKIWDERSKEVVRELSDKVYAMSVTRNKVAVAMANHKVVVYDTRSSKDLETEEETGLGKHQIRSLKCMPDGEGYAAGSVEGRIALEYFEDMKTEDLKPFSYKCHRVNKEDETTKFSYIYPVNDISFHPGYKTFVSAGSDGLITTWDPVKRKRIMKRQFDCGVSNVCFNKDGSKLAVGISYNYDNDVSEMAEVPAPQICLIEVTDSFVKAKAK